MNRADRRATAAKQRRQANPDNSAVPDRAGLLRIVAAALEADDTMSGVTLIEPNGTITHIDAATLRQGGRA
jgi:hypothetical protein